MKTKSGLGTTSRRQLILSLAACGAMGVTNVRAEGSYPSQPLRIVVPFGPGGLADISTRLLAKNLGDKLGQPVLIENRPGAGGVAAANTALSAPRDGYTLILFSNGTAIAKTLLKLPYDAEADFVPVSTLGYFDLLLLVSKASPFHDLKALLAEGKRRPVTLATINPGSTQHLSAELFKSVSGVTATLVPFKTSSEVQSALQRGDVDLGFESYAALRGATDAGLLRPLATTGSARTLWLPQIPTVREAGLGGYEVTGWNAIYTTKGTPLPVLELLSSSIRELLIQPDLRKRLLELGVDPKGSTSAELAALFERDKRKWAQVIQQAKIKV